MIGEVALSTETFGTLCFCLGLFVAFGIVGLMKAMSNGLYEAFKKEEEAKQ